MSRPARVGTKPSPPLSVRFSIGERADLDALVRELGAKDASAMLRAAYRFAKQAARDPLDRDRIRLFVQDANEG